LPLFLRERGFTKVQGSASVAAIADMCETDCWPLYDVPKALIDVFDKVLGFCCEPYGETRT
jgi:hypothetical protein